VLSGCSVKEELSSVNAQHEIPEIDRNAPINYETATFSMGCFWGPDSRFGSVEGVIRTRVGYAGGITKDPTYYNLGDHSETVQVDFDPTVVSYEELLKVFWQGHDPTIERSSIQYRSAILYANEEQQKIAEASRTVQEEQRGTTIFTSIEPLDRFYLAEAYHQKFRLRNLEPVDAEFMAIYPELQDYINSTAVMRVNAFLGGYGTVDDLEDIESQLGLSSEALEILKQKLVSLGWVIDCS